MHLQHPAHSSFAQRLLLACAFAGVGGGPVKLRAPLLPVDGRRLDSCDPGLVPWDAVGKDAFFDDYRTVSEIRCFLQLVHDEAPSVSKLVTYGTSFEDRTLELLVIGLDASSSPLALHTKPLLFIQATQHAREWIALAASCFLASSLVTQALEGGQIAELLERFTIAIAPLANPDGYQYSRDVNRMWRKNLATGPPRQECSWDRSGVDMNRNWDWKWKQGDTAQYINQLGRACQEVYAGPAPFSEPETRALADYVIAWNDTGVPVVGFVDVHSYGALLLPPWGWTPAPTADESFQNEMSAAMVQGIEAASGRTYSAGAQLLGSDPGTAPDWSYGALGIKASLTVELPPTDYNPGFCLAASEIRDVGQELVAGMTALLTFLDSQGLGAPVTTSSSRSSSSSVSSTTATPKQLPSDGWTRKNGVYCTNWRDQHVLHPTLESCYTSEQLCMWNCGRKAYQGLKVCESTATSECGGFLDQAAGSEIGSAEPSSGEDPKAADQASGAMRSAVATLRWRSLMFSAIFVSL